MLLDLAPNEVAHIVESDGQDSQPIERDIKASLDLSAQGRSAKPRRQPTCIAAHDIPHLCLKQ